MRDYPMALALTLSVEGEIRGLADGIHPHPHKMPMQQPWTEKASGLMSDQLVAYATRAPRVWFDAIAVAVVPIAGRLQPPPCNYGPPQT
jgi:hypothetical protein